MRRSAGAGRRPNCSARSSSAAPIARALGLGLAFSRWARGSEQRADLNAQPAGQGMRVHRRSAALLRPGPRAIVHNGGMNRLVAGAAVGSALIVAQPSLSSAQTRNDVGRPRMIEVSSAAPEQNAQLSSLIVEIRSEADAFVFLSGGAANMRTEHQRKLLAMFEALALVAKGGLRIAVGDGGTRAGVMEAAGRARRASGNAFPLIGVAPAREVQPSGKTPLDPNHSHIVAVDNPSAPAHDSWGSRPPRCIGCLRS